MRAGSQQQSTSKLAVVRCALSATFPAGQHGRDFDFGRGFARWVGGAGGGGKGLGLQVEVKAKYFDSGVGKNPRRSVGYELKTSRGRAYLYVGSPYCEREKALC